MTTVAWCLFVSGLLFVGFDIARLTITGLFVAGVVLLVIWGWLIGVFTKAFWISDAEEGERLDAVDRDIDARQIDWDTPVGYAHADRLAALTDPDREGRS